MYWIKSSVWNPPIWQAPEGQRIQQLKCCNHGSQDDDTNLNKKVHTKVNANV